MTDWKRIYQGMIEDCRYSDGTTDWEKEFLESIAEQLEENDHLTLKQITTLENIHERVAP